VTPLNDTVDEKGETVTVTLIADPDYTVASASTATVTIVDDDSLPAVRFSLAASSRSESTTPAAIDATLSAPRARQ